NADTTGGETGYCIDRRYASRGNAACLTAELDQRIKNWPCNDPATQMGCGRSPAGSTVPLAACDMDENGLVTAAECCQGGFQQADGDAADLTCDPFYQDRLEPMSTYMRDANLPQPTRDCKCTADPSPQCRDVVEIGCFDENGNLRPEREGQYAVKFVARAGGVVYDPAIK